MKSTPIRKYEHKGTKRTVPFQRNRANYKQRVRSQPTTGCKHGSYIALRCCYAAKKGVIGKTLPTKERGNQHGYKSGVGVDTIRPFYLLGDLLHKETKIFVHNLGYFAEISQKSFGPTLGRNVDPQNGKRYGQLAVQEAQLIILAHTDHTVRWISILLNGDYNYILSAKFYPKVSKQTLVLGRLQATCELLRRVIRCLMLSQRLQQQLLNGPRDITKAASSLSELDHLGRDVDLTGLEVLERDQRLIRQARSDVEKQAVQMMDRGMDQQNQTQVGTALQVFHNLGILVPSVEKVLDSLITRLNKSVSQSLDVNVLTAITDTNKKGGPGKAIMPGPGNLAQFRASLWSNLEKLMDDIYHVCVQTSHLHRVLSKKRDPVSHVCFLDEVQSQGKGDLFTRVWKNITRILTEEFAKAAQGSTFIRQALEVDYPKLVRLYGDLWRRLEIISTQMRGSSIHLTTDLVDGVAEDEKGQGEDNDDKEEFDPEQALRKTLVPLEKAYLSRSLSRLFDPVNLMFVANDAPPAKDEVDALIKTITSELNVSAVDQGLSETVAKNVVKTLHLFCTKSEQLLVTDGEASQVIGPATPGQALNVSVVNQLLYVYNQVERTASATLAHLPQSVTLTLKQSLPPIEALMKTAIQPLFSSITDAIEAIVLTMHNEDFSSSNNEGGTGDFQCSLYMKELQGFITRIATDYLMPYHLSSVIKEQIQSLGCRCLEVFVRHASLLRPIGDGGKLRLAADFAQMELAINPLCSRPSELGRPYRIVRAFRPFLFQTPEHIIASPIIGEVIPYSTVLHFLFAKAPPELRSPHQTAGWSVTRYSAWLDDHHDERERLQLVRGALEAYVASVRSKHITQFAAVYPVMLKLLEKGTTAHG
ncbi:unnamed protein product, partial [Meganyctiphanes norvegica]